MFLAHYLAESYGKEGRVSVRIKFDAMQCVINFLGVKPEDMLAEIFPSNMAAGLSLPYMDASAYSFPVRMLGTSAVANILQSPVPSTCLCCHVYRH